MFKSICPSCNHIFWKPEIKQEKETYEYKWYQLARNKTFCPNCHKKLGTTKRTKLINSAWYFLFIPLWLVIILGGWPEETTIYTKSIIYTVTVAYLIISIKFHEYKIENN